MSEEKIEERKKTIEELKEEVKRIEEELKRIEESTSALKIEKANEWANKLSNLRSRWIRVYECMFGNCTLTVEERYGHGVNITVDTPVATTLNVNTSTTLEKVFEIVREEIVKRLPEFAKYTADILSDVVKIYEDAVEKPLQEMKNITRSIDEIKERIERVEEKVNEIEAETEEEDEEEDC